MAPPDNDNGLAEYASKRSFAQTADPTPEAAGGRWGPLLFVVQQHAARRLHYDFRLELDGVLISWAIPKGVPLQTGDKHLAVRTEDHPLDYASFEGVIPPKQQYQPKPAIDQQRLTWFSCVCPHDHLARAI